MVWSLSKSCMCGSKEQGLQQGMYTTKGLQVENAARENLITVAISNQ